MAQMIVHALKTAGSDDPDKLVSALEGWKFLAPKGFQAIRPQDHAMLQPMFRVKLVSKNGKLAAQVLGTANSFATAPPVVAMRG
jgi:branched-chain amino acid transport system substrate-binding protein